MSRGEWEGRGVWRTQRRNSESDPRGNLPKVSPAPPTLLSLALLTTSLVLCRLLAPSHPLLPALGTHLTFDIAIGLNGQIWLSSPSVVDTLCAIACIKDLGLESGDKDDVAQKVGGFVRKWREKVKTKGARLFEEIMDVDEPKRVDDSEEEEEGGMELDA